MSNAATHRNTRTGVLVKYVSTENGSVTLTRISSANTLDVPQDDDPALAGSTLRIPELLFNMGFETV